MDEPSSSNRRLLRRQLESPEKCHRALPVCPTDLRDPLILVGVVPALGVVHRRELDEHCSTIRPVALDRLRAAVGNDDASAEGFQRCEEAVLYSRNPSGSTIFTCAIRCALIPVPRFDWRPAGFASGRTLRNGDQTAAPHAGVPNTLVVGLAQIRRVSTHRRRGAQSPSCSSRGQNRGTR